MIESYDIFDHNEVDSVSTQVISIFIFLIIPTSVFFYLLQGRLRRIFFGKRVKGKIVEMRHNTRGMYFYFVEYEAYGVQRLRNTHVFITREFNVLDAVEIAYNPDNPDAYSIVRDKNVYLWGIAGFIYVAFFAIKIFAPETLHTFLPNVDRLRQMDVPTFLMYLSTGLIAFGLLGMFPILRIRFRGTQTTGEIINKVPPQLDALETNVYNPHLQFKTDFGMHDVKIRYSMERNPAYQVGNRLAVWYLESNPNKNLFGKQLQQNLFFYSGFIFMGLLCLQAYFVRSSG